MNNTLTLYFALLVFGATFQFSKAAPRNFSDIRYRFTPCGASGNLGPPFSACTNYYASINSPILKEGLLFEFEGSNYRGAQGFRVPRDGLYNITVVGASGGRGICNVQNGGKGVFRKVQMQLTTDMELLVMVGQEGIGACDVIPESDRLYDEICARPPTNMSQAEVCNATWLNRTRNFDRLYYDIFGGGGGGGASMVRARSRSSGVFDNLPIVISGGGGGTAALLYYDVVEVIMVDFFLFTNEIAYEVHTDGKTTTNPSFGETGRTGFQANNMRPDNFIAGAGGGFNLGTQTITDMTGSSFNVPLDFAEGGIDCAQSQRQFRMSGVPFVGTVGGFGGGGAGCAEGGGGGGYTGGGVLRGGVTVPGSGGFSYTGLDVTLITSLNGQNRGDGYVDIIRADCGCVHECITYSDEDQFECVCPTNSTIAPDLSDCYFNSLFTVREQPFLDYVLLEFPNSLYIFSIDVELAQDISDGRCLLFFTGANSQIVMVSNIVRESGNANMLALLISNNTFSNYTHFLNSSVLVTGAILVSSSAECSLRDLTIRVNASIQSSSAGILTTQSPISTNVLLALVNSVLFPTSPSPPDSTTTDSSNNGSSTTEAPLPNESASLLSSGQLIGIIVGGVVVFILVVLLFGALAGWRIRRKQSVYEGKGVEDADTVADLPLTPTNEYVFSGEGKHFSMSVASEHVRQLPQEIMISSKNLKLGKMIGEGEFGSVYKAKLEVPKSTEPPLTVAVKTLKGFFSPHHVDDMMKETRKMCRLKHPNVLSLIGVCIDGGPSPYIVMPFMKNGSLLSYLRKNKETFLVKQSDDSETATASKRLTEMCFQVAKGMEYLASNRIIHRDLAARNCMINEKNVICVADFGLSENIYTKNYFRQENHTSVPLPMKWTAPESLSYGIFSEKTDVWSFGVTCWEVFSAGKIPYPGITAQSIPKLVEGGHRMDKPENAACTDTMYGVMKQCWYADAEDRPTFSELIKIMESDLETMAEYLPLGTAAATSVSLSPGSQTHSEQEDHEYI